MLPVVVGGGTDKGTASGPEVGLAAMWIALALALPAAWACAPSLAGLRPAEVAPRGHVQVAAGVAVGIPTGTVSRTVDAARTLAQAAATQQLTAPQKLQLFEASASFVGSPPSVGPHLSAAYSVRDDTELNLQYASGAWRLGSRLQILRRTAGPFDLVAGVGASHAGQVASIGDVLPVVHLHGVQRWLVDLPIEVGTSRSWFRVWGGPKLAYTQVSAGAELDLVNGEKASASLTLRGIYWGAQGGLAIGYRALFIGFELTVLEFVASGDAVTTVSAARTGLDVGGWLLTPAVALMGEL